MILKQILSRARGAALAWSAVACLGALLGLTACDPSRGIQIEQEISEPHFVRARELQRSGRNQEALEAFIKVIDKRGSSPGAPESHLEAGQIFLNHIKDPYSAIYHFKRYLEFRPNSQQAPQVRQLIESAQKDAARSFPGNPFGAQTEKSDLLDAMDKLKKENDDLRVQLARATGRAPTGNTAVAQNPQQRPPANSGRTPSPAPVDTAGMQPLPADYGPTVSPVPVDTPAVPVQNPPASTRPPSQPTRPNNNVATNPPASGRTYTAQPGDTLYKISVKYYGTGSRWPAILDANRDQLRSERDIKVGMVLKIP